MFAAVFDVVSMIAGEDHPWARELWHAGTFTFPLGIAVLSVAIVLLVSAGATFGGSMAYEYGFNVETAGFHQSFAHVLDALRTKARPFAPG